MASKKTKVERALAKLDSTASGKGAHETINKLLKGMGLSEGAIQALWEKADSVTSKKEVKK